MKVTIKDVYGNIAEDTIQVTVLDRIPLSCTINYNPSGNTNQNVIATLTGCNKSVTVTNNGGNTNYTFSANGNFTFQYKDAYGNTGSTQAVVNWIDKVKPEGTISYSTTSWTNQDVTATLTTTKVVTKPSGWSGAATGTSFTKTYSANITETVSFSDLVTNTNSVTVSIANIDKTAPVCGTWSYSPTVPTSGNVVATLA